VAQLLAEVSVGDVSFSPRCLDMQAHECVDWQQTHLCIFICATAGDGIPPVHAQEFFKFLGAQKSLDLSHLRYALLAPGNSSYPAYCQAGKFLNELLQARGAKAFLDLFELDQEDEIQVGKWLALLGEKIQQSSLLEKLPSYQDDYLLSRVDEYFAKHGSTLDSYSKNNPYYAKVLVKRSLCKVLEADDRETIHMELDLSGAEKNFSWSPGDSIGVLPENCPDTVNEVLSLLSFDKNHFISLNNNQPALSLNDLLLKFLDITVISKNLLDFLLAHASAQDLQKWQHFVEQYSDEAYGVFIKQYDLVAALSYFSSALAAINAENIAALFKPMQPRYYSISSSMLANPKRLSITVAAVRYETENGMKKGLASTFLVERVREGDQLAIFVQRNPQFRLPDAPDKTCIMIGPGTGVAPFRAFVEELKARHQLSKQQSEPQPKQQHVLYFGSRHKDRDFLYGDEWQALAANQELNLFTAFSRDQNQKIYVQHRLLEQQFDIWQNMEKGAYFYVCGDATKMASDVEATLLHIIQQQGGMNEAAARDYLKSLADAGRYNKDVWA